jgi:hypothetical protein
MKRLSLLVVATLLAMLLTVLSPARATETENQGLRILPAPGRVAVDGAVSDWDLSGGLFACGDVERMRDQYALWVHAMADAENLYVLARWKDPTPLNNPENLGGHGFNGDCLQVRFILFPGTPDETVSWWDCWRDARGTAVAGRGWPGPRNGVTSNPLSALTPAEEQRVRQAYFADPDGKGYAQEIAIPWTLLSAAGKVPGVGEKVRMTVEPNFTAGAFGRITIKDLFDPAVKAPDRIFTFRAYKHWGFATREAKGNVAPQPVRLADGRTFPVSLQGGQPVVDWTGLVRKFEWSGFKPITFTMPFDGVVSLNILAADGTVARHLLNGDGRAKGTYTVQWDGLSDATFRTPGVPVPAGDYTWKALAHPGAKLTLRGYASFGGRVPWESGPKDFWLGDHGEPSAVVTDGARIYLACNGAEGGRHLLATDFQGNLLWGLQNTTGAADPEHIAVADGVVYVLHPKARWLGNAGTITRVEANSGAYLPWPGTRSHILRLDTIWPQGQTGTDHFNGLDVRDGTLYATAPDALVILDIATGKVVKSWPVPLGGAVKAVSATRVYVISDGTTVLALDPATGTTTPVITGLKNARGLTVDAAGKLYVSVAAPDMQVQVFSTRGKKIGTIGRKGGRAPLGAWQADGLFNPAGVAVDREGKLWVMEHDAHPKRVSVWNLTNGKLVTDFFGPTQYGASGSAINPRDPNLMVGVGCEWRLDPAIGKSVCVGVFDRRYHGFATFREGKNGKLYLYTFYGQYGIGGVQVWERLGDARYALRAELRSEGDVRKGAGGTVLWVDANGDGKEDPEELQRQEGVLLCAGSNSWSLNLGPELTLYAFDSKERRLKALPADGFTACGAPNYQLAAVRALPAAMSAGYETNYSCALPSADNTTLLVNARVKDHPAGFVWKGFDLATGALKWSYPNPYFQVHGSHLAPAPDPGLFRGAFGPVGAVDIKGVGNCWLINGNVGEWNVLTSDGFYLTRLFNGNVFEWHWPADATPGVDMTNLPPGCGGEDFGGSATQATDGKVYVQAGKMAIWNLALTGLEGTVAIPGGRFTLTEAETKQALALREASLQAANAGAKTTAKRVTVAFTGNLNNDFKGCPILDYRKIEEAQVRTALAHDDTHLYLGWDVRDTTPWINGATDISQMYACGDTVDFQLGGDPAANPKRGEAVKGDLRLSIGNYQGKPTAVLYKFISADKKPRVFTSGVIQGYQVDWVEVLAEAKVQVKVDKDRYIVEAAIPLASLGLPATPKLTLRGDVGATHGEASGTRTKLRTYWSNQSTGLVDDVVFELKLTPANWGEITLE